MTVLYFYDIQMNVLALLLLQHFRWAGDGSIAWQPRGNHTRVLKYRLNQQENGKLHPSLYWEPPPNALILLVPLRHPKHPPSHKPGRDSNENRHAYPNLIIKAHDLRWLRKDELGLAFTCL